MTHVLLAELATQRQDVLAARVRAATLPTRRTRRHGSGPSADRLPAWVRR
jgi:hypothetical protein